MFLYNAAVIVRLDRSYEYMSVIISESFVISSGLQLSSQITMRLFSSLFVYASSIFSIIFQ